MTHCIFDKLSKKCVGGARWDVLPYDPETQVHLELPDLPTDNELLNDTEDGIRQRTQAEQDAAFSVETETKTRARFTERENTTLLLLYKADQRLRILEGRTAIDKDVFWEQVKTVHNNEQFFDF